MIKYIKSVLWRIAKRLSYIEDARCLKVKIVGTIMEHTQAMKFKIWVVNLPMSLAKLHDRIHSDDDNDDDDDDDGVISKHVAAIKLDKKRENLMQATSHTNSEWKFIMSSIFCASGITELRT